MDKKRWQDTNEGRMTIYYVAIDLVDNMGEYAYIKNSNANVNDTSRIINFLWKLITDEWIGD